MDNPHCACGAADRPSSSSRSLGWECGVCGRRYSVGSLGGWVEIRGPGPGRPSLGRRIEPYESVPFEIPPPKCSVAGCLALAATLEPIYAMKVDKAFVRENVVACYASLCRTHAGLLSWSI